jgi:site-specific recombinase
LDGLFFALLPQTLLALNSPMLQFWRQLKKFQSTSADTIPDLWGLKISLLCFVHCLLIGMFGSFLLGLGILHRQNLVAITEITSVLAVGAAVGLAAFSGFFTGGRHAWSLRVGFTIGIVQLLIGLALALPVPQILGAALLMLCHFAKIYLAIQRLSQRASQK